MARRCLAADPVCGRSLPTKQTDGTRTVSVSARFCPWMRAAIWPSTMAAAPWQQNYEEQTGLAHTFDLKTFYALASEGPDLTSPHGSGSLRYIDVVPVGHELFYYYEMAAPDGSHDLRVSVVERD